MDTEQADHPFRRRYKNAILLATLLLIILLSPLIQLFEGSKLLEMALSTIVISAALHAISYRKQLTIIFAVALGLLAIGSGWMQAVYSGNVQQLLSHIFGAALYIYIAALLFKAILVEKEITVDQIFAAVTIYIFIGLTWGHLYAMVGIFDPESILGITVPENGNESDFVYFSFVTLTTLGFGDMLPVNAMTKALVIVEAITGVMFVAILVSTLVGKVNMKR